MSSVRPIPEPPKRSATTAQPLLLGARVRLQSREATGVIIGNSRESNRVRVRWDDTGEVTRCLRANLVPVRWSEPQKRGDWVARGKPGSAKTGLMRGDGWPQRCRRLAPSPAPCRGRLWHRQGKL